MAKLSERENLLRLYRGEIPAWVPISEHAINRGFGPVFLRAGRGNRLRQKGDRFRDIFGVLHEISDPRFGPMPAPDEHRITDISKWREQFPVAGFPDLDSFDWEAAVKEETADWDRENKYIKYSFGGTGSGSSFVWMASLLGNAEALEAMLTEPEAWDDLLDALTVFQEGLVARIGAYFRPDSIVLCDDLAFNKGTFMSPALYRERIKPFHKRLVDAIVKAGCDPEIHCCGKADTFADDFVDIGLRSWNPAQRFNDLEGVKARHGNRLILDGAWDSNGPAAMRGADEAVVRAAVRSAMDRCAPGGGYVFSTSGMTEVSYVGEEHMRWIYDEAVRYGRQFYA